MSEIETLRQEVAQFITAARSVLETPDHKTPMRMGLLVDTLQSAVTPTEKAYTFYVDGVGKEVVMRAESEKAAHKKAWESLTSEERNMTACLDCIEVSA